MRNAALLLVLALGCQGQTSKPKADPPKLPQSEATKPPAPPQNTPTSAASSSASGGFEDPLPRWSKFLTDRFGEPPGPSFVGDFNGDGKADVAIDNKSSLLVFHDTQEKEPTKWEVLNASKGAPIEIKDAAWALSRLPALAGKINDKQSVIVVGHHAPLVNVWLSTETTYAWLQVIPDELSAARKDAEERLKASFGLTKNNLFGDPGSQGEGNLKQAFAGDFDNDTKLDLVVVDNESDPNQATLHFYKAGALPPVVQKVSYAGTKAALYHNPKPTSLEIPYESDEVKPGPFTIQGDYIDLWLPEKSGVFLAFDKNKWNVLWMSD